MLSKAKHPYNTIPQAKGHVGFFPSATLRLRMTSETFTIFLLEARSI
ncbi:hypothetical protein [Flagellimonas marina]|uniref:Uncharacterized protein n=1 Tax=Flagellimonas marina TaxID=1775168 RepID=A0ABV8PS84_9FLAO